MRSETLSHPHRRIALVNVADVQEAVCTSRHARQTLSGVAGMLSLAPAPFGIALAIAFMIAASEAVVPASPTPFTPSGLVVAGTGCRGLLTGGMSSARGMP